MAVKPLPPTELLRQLFKYDPESGYLFHKAGPRLGKLAFNYVSDQGYRYGLIDGRKYLTHRIIWKIVTGQDPNNQIDHIDGCRSNNKISNLRDVSNQENGRNRHLQKTNKSGASGVSFEFSRQRWRARIWDGKPIHIGYYQSKADAISARKTYEEKMGYASGHGRTSTN